MCRRAWFAGFAVVVIAVYAVIALEVARSEFMLVNDFRPFAMARLGVWPSAILQTLLDPTRPDSWLYRPFPDLMEWLLSSVFGAQPGMWHLIILALRLITLTVGLAIAREFGSPPAAVSAAAYLAFFPAIPEINLLRADNWLMPALALVTLGLIRIVRRSVDVSARWWWTTAIAFIVATTCKEVIAPFLALLFVIIVPYFLKRGLATRLMATAMLIALANQSIRFALMFSEPYATGGSSLDLGTIAGNGYWIAKVMLLATNSFPAFSLVLAVLFILGSKRLIGMTLVNGTRRVALGILAMQALALAMAITSPHHAIRYLYPAALFSVPSLALAMDEVGTLAGNRARDVLALASVALLAGFGGASLWAQAASARASSIADWEMLQTIGRAFGSGRDVVVIEDPDFERSFWIRAELVGVDPRWPLLSYASRQYASGQAVSWPKSSVRPVQLTRWKRSTRYVGRFLMVGKTHDLAELPGNPVITLANPLTDDVVIPQSLAIAQRFDERSSSRSSLVLIELRRYARMLNRRFRFGHDLGETEFPGHYWILFTIRRQ